MTMTLTMKAGVTLQPLPAAPEWHPTAWQIIVCILVGLAAAVFNYLISWHEVGELLRRAAAIGISLVLGFVGGLVVGVNVYAVMRDTSGMVTDWRQETASVPEDNIRRVRDHYGLRTLDLNHEREKWKRGQKEKSLWQRVGDVLNIDPPQDPWDGDPGNEGHWAVTYTVRDDTLPAFDGTRLRRDGDDRLRLVKEKTREATLVIRRGTAVLFDKKNGKELGCVE